MVSRAKGVGAPAEINERVKHDILVYVRVALSIHTLGDYIGRQFSLLAVFKFNNVLAGVKNGFLVGAANNIAVVIPRKLEYAPARFTPRARELYCDANVGVRSF